MIVVIAMDNQIAKN